MSFGGSVKLTGESEYRKALSQISQNLREVSSQMKVVSSSYDKNDTSMQALSAKQDVLNKKLSEQSERLKVLTNRYNEVNSQYGKNSDAQQQLNKELTEAKAKLNDIGNELGTSSKEYKEQAKVVKDLETKQDSYNKAVSDAKIKMNEAQAEFNKTDSAVKKLGQQMKDAEKPTDDLGDAVKDTGEEAKKASNDGFTVLKGTLANLTSQAITSAINGLKKLGSAIISVGKQAISSYADYEQLVGGVETLFKDSSDIVQKYAANAYKTAGLSANEYMETVTSFSASLLQSLNQDTAKAAKVADVAITDMSDNANKMGTSMEMIQNAYQGFAKQNYTMLDNLKLGYGGTKKEMERLIADANKVKKANGEMADLSIESFADMVEAIHIIQTEMGITGTTAKEADSTIQGSVKSMKSAWKNLLTAIADDNQDLSKSVDEFVKSAITAAKNLVPRIKTSVDGLKRLVNGVINEVFPKLKRQVPELKPLIETFEWFIKNKDKVITAVKLMVGAFVVAKIANFTKAMTDGIKGVIDFVKQANLATGALKLNTIAQGANTTAQIAGTAATNGLKTAVNLLNAAWSANPVGLVVGAVSAGIGIFSLFKNKTDEVTEAQKRQNEELERQTGEINENIDAWNDLVETQKKQIDAGMTEINHYENLYDELNNIVDANGKVKDGYEERASFIVSTLNNALGTEISMTGNVIKNYGSLRDSIQQVMDKKKAQIILESQESLYTEAINNKTEANKKLLEIETQLNDKKAERNSVEAEYNARLEELQPLLEKATEQGKEIIINDDKQVQGILAKMEAIDQETATLESNYNSQEDLVSSYYYNIGLYEQNAALAHAGNYDQMSQVTWEYVKDYQGADDAQRKILEDQVKYTQSELDRLYQLKKDNSTDIYNQQISDGEKQLARLKEQMKAYYNETDVSLDKVTLVWRDDLDDQLSEVTGSKIEFREGAEGNIEAYIDGTKAGEAKSKAEMASLVQKTILEISRQKTGSETAGKDLLDGINNGIANQRKQSGVFNTISNFGNKLLQRLKNSLQEKSPSKATNEMGQFLLAGLGIGMEKEEGSVLKQIGNFGKNVLGTFRKSLNNGSSISLGTDLANITSDAQGNINTSANIGRNLKTTNNSLNNENSYKTMVEGFKQALSEMKIEMDDEQFGKFVSKTVADEIYA